MGMEVKTTRIIMSRIWIALVLLLTVGAPSVGLAQVLSETRFGALRCDFLGELAFHVMTLFDGKPEAYAGAGLST